MVMEDSEKRGITTAGISCPASVIESPAGGEGTHSLQCRQASFLECVQWNLVITQLQSLRSRLGEPALVLHFSQQARLISPWTAGDAAYSTYAFHVGFDWGFPAGAAAPAHTPTACRSLHFRRSLSQMDT